MNRWMHMHAITLSKYYLKQDLCLSNVQTMTFYLRKFKVSDCMLVTQESTEVQAGCSVSLYPSAGSCHE